MGASWTRCYVYSTVQPEPCPLSTYIKSKQMKYSLVELKHARWIFNIRTLASRICTRRVRIVKNPDTGDITR